MKQILTYPNPILKQQSFPVTNFGLETQAVIDKMLDIVGKSDYSVGLAAPQIGKLQRIIAVSEIEGERTRLLPLINPEIVFFSKETHEDYEGCLSIPFKVGLVERSTKIRIRALDRNGNKIKLKAAGLLAREIQHEVDHLNGLLFFDRTSADKIYNYTIKDGKWVIQKQALTAEGVTL
ncbi:peptide deformylase [candidate division WWE3 bacterium CG06_land_8_20_14_3_00_42_16]|uniref:Peptide deformylase n=4 Tax=Katanobacteria TaxID=422282 RepID=A0A2M7APK6_UNCKA|nr:MAG: peptide deformylase [candidate division WWE3 bacterium CG06_land_8_20_14_3_00_42_16]PIZ42852.1 MAG: peptide deformylase [candidate division WWE3 bacterium CG_4_10_14_0_2_um_filter_42_8]PJA38299.1 MAG: peptide deformylase [candidate division WWE3 bacterium CG_4_9_14_3_um_filter_43_9]PJC69074.1 MAG: peptide deformylase [candidate division WWE3 bacterium CG_4_8_14_3_um_filter_42_11]